MKKVFLAASGVFASIPGIGIIVSGLGTPPGYSKLFGGIMEALGALTLLLVALNKGKVQKLGTRQVMKTVIILTVASLCLVVVYLQLSAFCIVEHPIHGTVYYPLWSSGHLAEMLERTGGRYAAIDRYGFYPVTKAIQESPNYPLSIVVTTAVLLLVYQGIFTALTVAFGILGLRSDKNAVDALGVTSSRGTRKAAKDTVAAG